MVRWETSPPSRITLARYRRQRVSASAPGTGPPRPTASRSNPPPLYCVALQALRIVVDVSAPTMPVLQPRDHVGRYVVERQIGEGQFAEVYRVLDAETDTQVCGYL